MGSGPIWQMCWLKRMFRSSELRDSLARTHKERQVSLGSESEMPAAEPTFLLIFSNRESMMPIDVSRSYAGAAGLASSE